MIKIYGRMPSRLYRCLWMLEEIGAEYEIVSVDFDELKEPTYLAINPNGRMPALQDGEVTLWESMAINFYLAERYGNSLWPSTIESRAQLYKWTFWAVNEAERFVATIFDHRVALPRTQRVEATAAAAIRSLEAPIRVLDQALATRPFLLGEAFSAADLNVAAIMSTLPVVKVPLTTTPHLVDWLARCLSRPFPSRTFQEALAFLATCRG